MNRTPGGFSGENDSSIPEPMAPLQYPLYKQSLGVLPNQYPGKSCNKDSLKIYVKGSVTDLLYEFVLPITFFWLSLAFFEDEMA